MSFLTVDESLLSQLRSLGEPIAFRDSQGNIVGHFIPSAAPINPLDREPRISEKEMERREVIGGGRSLASILADLRAVP